MKYTSYKIKIRATINGVEKVPSKIAWIQGNDSCLVTPCYKENDYLVVELLPDCVGNACIEGYLLFDDVCTDCEPIHFKRCFCSTDEDCEDCEECTAQGVCVSKCIGDEYCLDDKCVECDPNNPCPNGKICINGKCVCPQGTFEKNGKCVECDENTKLTKCQECRDGKIIDRICDGKCDPNTGQCVDCLTSGDCISRTDGRNCCTADKQCDCCPGTVWSATQGKCIPVICTSDEECGDPCLKCTPEGCQPMICPPGYKCWEGTCVYWPCTSTSCENGADCGPECGCIELNGVKQCVPCHILNCLGLCQQALGCKCVNDICTPVDNCNQYCDGFSPCLDTNCTCYNNNCVSCENFPCLTEGGCTSYYNCGCNDANKCVGGGCNDKLTIKQECGSGESDCKLIAELTTKGCKCDPIKFQTTNKTTCTLTGDPSPNLALEVEIYKGQVLYSDFSNVAIGDNELLSGSIQTVITHYGVNGENVGTQIANITPITDKPISGNKITGTINITSGVHYKKTYQTLENGQSVTKGTLVKVEVFAKNVEIQNNDCINYEDGLIASYELNFRTTADSLATCTHVNTTFTQKRVGIINDLISSKKPLFIWSKGITDFSSGPYVNDKTYDQSGWFRKVYGVKSGNVWRDTISKHTEPDELFNNYNYQVKSDCGCATVANKSKVLFCCLPEFDYELFNCNKKLVLQPFNVCDVNGKVTDFAPEKSQTKYYIRLELKDGSVKEILIPFDTKTKTVTFTYDEPTKPSIVAATIFQSYTTGGLLSSRECPKELDINEVEDINVPFTRECGKKNPSNNVDSIKVTVPQVSGATKINKIEFFRQDVASSAQLNFNSGFNNSTTDLSVLSSYVTYLPNNAFDPTLFTVVMRVFFTSGCSKDITLQPCPVSVDIAEEKPVISSVNCPGGIGAAITAVTSGFNNQLPITYMVEGETLNQPLTNTTGIFTGLVAGFYILTAVQGDLIATSPFEVVDLEVPEVVLLPSTICQGQTATLSITAVQGTSFIVTGPNGLTIANPVMNSSGVYAISNLSTPGNYTVTMTADPTNTYCSPFTEVNALSVGGQALSPIIEIQPGNHCVGQPIPFRIRDNGALATYTLSSNGSGTINTTLQSSDTTYNGTYTPNSVNGIIRITGVTDTCNTTSTPQLLVTALPLPIIVSAVSSCSNNNTNTVTVVTSGTITGVTVDGVVATLTSPNTYTRTNVPVSQAIEIIVSNSTCQTTQTITAANCICPAGELTIVSSGDTCGQDNATVSFNGDTLGINGVEWFYVFQQMSGSNYIDLNNPIIFPPVPLSPAPSITVNTNVLEPKTYRLKAINSTNSCEYYSNSVTVSAVNPPIGLTITPSVQVPVTAGTPISFSTQAGFSSYTWGGDVLGNTNTSTPKIFTVPGTYLASVTVCSALGCCETINYTFDVVQNCTPIVFGTANSGLCSDITISATGGNGAKTYTVTGTYINVVSTPVPGSNVITIPTIEVPAGESDTITLTVIDANGCLETTEIEYTRCSCLCEGTTCGVISNLSTIATSVVGTHTKTISLGYHSLGDVFNWGLTCVGHPSYQYKVEVKLAGVTKLNTGWVTRQATACPGTYCSTPDFFLGDDPGVIALPLTTGVANVGILTAYSCDLIVPGALTGNITLDGDGEVTVILSALICGAGGGPIQNNFVITCV